MKWTREPPRVAGWWWWRDDDSPELHVVKLRWNGNEYRANSEFVNNVPVNELGGFWCDEPIREPEG